MNGTIASTPSYENTSGWSVIGADNFTPNGTTDLLWQSPSDGAVATWLFDHITAQDWLVIN